MSKIANVFNIQRYSLHDGPGIRTVIFFKGCSLECLWCSNPESISAAAQVLFNKNLCGDCGHCDAVCPSGALPSRTDATRSIDPHLCTRCGKCTAVCPDGALKLVGKQYTIDDLVEEAMKDAPFYSQSGGGVTVSGGEPLLQADAVASLLERLVGLAVHTAVETAGNVQWDSFARVIPHVDLFLFDVKHLDPVQHKRFTGHTNERIFDNLRRLGETEAQVLVRMPVIPNLNDKSDDMLRFIDIANRIRGLQGVELLPYHDFGVNKHAASGRRYALHDAKPPSPEHMRRLRTLLSEHLPVPVLYAS